MIIGTCSQCGGAVSVPDAWGGVIPPTPTCTQCGAVAANHGPIIPMHRPAFRPGKAFEYVVHSSANSGNSAAPAPESGRDGA